MHEDRSNGHGYVDRGPRLETTMDMTSSKIVSRYDPGSRAPHRKLTQTERAWINGSVAYPSDTLPTNNAQEDDE